MAYGNGENDCGTKERGGGKSNDMVEGRHVLSRGSDLIQLNG